MSDLNREDFTNLLNRLVKAESSVQELFSFAVLLKETGLGEREIAEVFYAARNSLQDEDEKADDLLCDTLDYITGNCAPHRRLFVADDTPAREMPK